MIKFSNGHSFEYMAASGALAFDGKGWAWEKPLKYLGVFDTSLFTVVTKTLTLEPKIGALKMYNPFGSIRFLNGGVVNAVGLTNPGIDWWCGAIGPKIKKSSKIVVSIIADSSEELSAMALKLKDFHLVGLELNMSCPNYSRDFSHMNERLRIFEMVQAVKDAVGFPLILKLSAAHDYLKIVKDTEGLVEAISVNSVPWGRVYKEKKSPFEHFGGGGVSGIPAQKDNWKMVKELAALAATPIIGPSVWNFEDIEKVYDCGAKAISFGSVFLRYPWRPTLFVKRLMKEK